MQHQTCAKDNLFPVNKHFRGSLSGSVISKGSLHVIWDCGQHHQTARVLLKQPSCDSFRNICIRLSKHSVRLPWVEPANTWEYISAHPKTLTAACHQLTNQKHSGVTWNPNIIISQGTFQERPYRKSSHRSYYRLHFVILCLYSWRFPSEVKYFHMIWAAHLACLSANVWPTWFCLVISV